MELSAYEKMYIINGMPIELIGEGELAEVNWRDSQTPAGEVPATDDEILPSPLATESLVLFFRNMITGREYLGYTNSKKTFVAIDGVNYEVMI